MTGPHCYIRPAGRCVSAAGVLLLLFAVRSLHFSKHLAKAGFSPEGEGSLDLKLYFHDLLLFLSFSVAVSLAGCLPVLVYGLFL